MGAAAFEPDDWVVPGYRQPGLFLWRGVPVKKIVSQCYGNAWDNTKSPGNLPNASDTTYNVSLLTGNVESEWGRYNGGAENLPRFHERWSGRTCTLRGSLTVLWNSRYANALRLGSYSPPRRDGSFDTDLFQLDNMPPFTPMVSEVEDLLSW